MNGARYLIAKYVSDLLRNEPRNVGVVVWSDAGIAARFLHERADKPGTVDRRRFGVAFTPDTSYPEWVAFWRGEIACAQGNAGSAAAGAMLDDLVRTTRGNFQLADAGEVYGAAVDPESLADELFGRLVRSGEEDGEPRDPTLEERSDALVQRVGLAAFDWFKRDYGFRCVLPGGTEEDYKFSYAVRNGVLRRVYDRVPLRSKMTRSQRKSLDGIKWKCEKTVQGKIEDNGSAALLKTDDVVVLVDVPTELAAEDAIVRNQLAAFGQVARVVNLADESGALAEFEAAAKLHVDVLSARPW